ncbi:hypothetical protein QBC39DRAFT_148567 [Podospora conica]|nr:hypothetical protein QBC39DRAFT_148567 [Schizothecium conicum]
MAATYSAVREQSPVDERGRKPSVRVDQQSFHHDSSQSPKRESGTSTSSSSRQHAWGPRWLHITTIAAFALAIIAPIITIPILVDRSRRDNGLGNGGEDLEYILKFAPVAYFTLIAALWTRAELQAMRYTPWAAMAEGRDLGKHGLTLDYADMFWWFAFWRSLKNRHMLVFAVMLVSLLLKITIPLAAALIHSTTVGLPASTEVQVLDTFSPDRVPADLNFDAKLNDEFGLYAPFYQLKAILNFDMEYPFGMTENEAYQTFEIPGFPFDSSVQATAVVDRIQTDLVCDLSKSSTVKKQISLEDADFDRRAGFFTDIEFEFDKCEKWRATLPPFWWVDFQHPDSADGANRLSWMYGMGPSGNLSDTPRAPCGLTAAPREFLLISTTQRRAGVNDSLPTSFEATAMICAPKTWTSKVEVSRNGSDIRLTPLADSPSKEIPVDIDGLVQSFVPTVGDWRSSVDSQNVTMWVYSALRYAVEFRDGTFINPNGPIHPTMNQTEIRDVLTQFYRKVGTMGIHALLRTPAQQTVAGSVVAQVSRVLVNDVVAYILVGILCTILLGMATAALRLPSRGLYDVDPTTILGAAVAFKKAPAFLRQGRTETGVLKTAPSWEKPNTAPYLLRSETRLISITLLIGLIAALLVTLNISNTSNGIASIPTNGYNPIVSSIVPTVLLLLVAMYAGASNASVRNLTTFSNASARDCGAKDLSLSYLDMIGPRVLWHSTTRHIWTMTLTETAATLAAFLTTFAGLLFRVENIEVSSVVQLQQASWFGNPDLVAGRAQTDVIPDGRQMIIAFLLNSTSNSAITYTPGSYQDLIFPLFERPANSEILTGNNVTVWLTVPALTLQSTCVDLAPSEYNVTVRSGRSNRGDSVCNIELNTLHSNGSSLGFVRIPNAKTNTYGYGDLALYPHVRAMVSEPSMEQYPRARVLAGSGAGSANCTREMEQRIHDWWVETYFWGKVAAPANKTMEYSSMTRCNYTWTEVDVDITLKGNDLSLDYDNPPKPRWETKRAPGVRHPLPTVGGQWECPQVDDTGFLDLPTKQVTRGGDRFIAVEAPFGSLPASMYGSDQGKSAVVNALTRMISIVYAQAASVDNRLSPDGTSMTDPVRQETLPATVATVSTFDRMRLIQRPVPTYALVTLLSVIAAINIYALLSAVLVRWGRDGSPLCLDMTMQNVAPANSGSIAVMARLLASSNILRQIPDPAETGERLDLQRVRAIFDGMCFRIGWFQSPSSRQPIFTVGYLGDERMPFLGRKMESSRQQSAAEGDLGYSNYQ